MVTQNNWFYYIDTNDVQILLNDHVNTFFLEEDGFGLDGVEPIAERVAFEHGLLPIGVYLPEREILLRIGILAQDDASWREQDDRLNRLCSPFLDEAEPGILRRVYVGGLTRDIKAWLTGYAKPSAGREGPAYGERLLKFWCPDPFFYDPVPTEFNYGLSGSGGLTFPITYDLTYPESNINDICTVNNLGDVKAFPLIYIYGPLRNPQINNLTTNNQMQITQTLAVGEHIIIDMKECTLLYWNGSTYESITENITVDTEFWSLRRGGNEIHFIALDANNGGIILYFNTRYQSA